MNCSIGWAAFVHDLFGHIGQGQVTGRATGARVTVMSVGHCQAPLIQRLTRFCSR